MGWETTSGWAKSPEELRVKKGTFVIPGQIERQAKGPGTVASAVFLEPRLFGMITAPGSTERPGVGSVFTCST